MEIAINYINSLDLSYLSERLVNKHQWELKDAEDSVRRYKNCLILLVKYPGTAFIPTPDIDEVWHAHILHTKEYLRDSKEIFGRFLHHDPVTTKTTDERKQEMNHNYIKLAQLYEREFHELYPQYLDFSTFY